MGRTTLGELEHLVLIAIVGLGEQAYGAAIIEQIEAHTDRDLSHAACYITLQRLERKGLVNGTEGESAPERGGRPRRYFVLTTEGTRRLEESSRAIFSMWDRVAASARKDLLG